MCVASGGIVVLVVGVVIGCCESARSGSLVSMSICLPNMCTCVVTVFLHLDVVAMVCTHTLVCIRVLVKRLHQLVVVFGGLDTQVGVMIGT